MDENEPNQGGIDRRKFLAAAGLTSLAFLANGNCAACAGPNGTELVYTQAPDGHHIDGLFYEISTLQKEFRVRIDHSGMIPVPVTESRTYYRQLNLHIVVNESARKSIGLGLGLTAIPEVDAGIKVLEFLVCCAGLAALVTAMAATFEVGPITWPALIGLFTKICLTCLGLLGGAAVVESLKPNGSTSESGRWGAWG